MSTTSPVSGLECSVAYINGRVWTVDSANSWASGFIVSDNGLFTHVGTSDEIQSIAKEHHLITVNLKNNFTMPGIHDAHMHLLFSGLGITSSAVISPEATHLDIAHQVKTGSCACEYINAYQDWVLAGAYNNQGFPDGLADRKYLDHLYPDTPVMVRGGAGHAVLLNTEALKRAGYDVENEPDAHGTRFLRREDGSLTGEMAENAMAKAFIALPFPDRAHVKRALKHAIWLAHKAGVTSTQEASSNTALLRALSEMEHEGSLKLDICTHIVYNCEWLGSESRDNLNRLLETATEYKSKHVDTRFVKIMLDGVPLPPLWTQAGVDEQGNVEHSKITTPDVAEAIMRFDQEGRTVKVHCAGSGAARLALDAIEKARQANPNGPRHELAHNSNVTDEDYKRYQPLNITAEMSPAELFVNPMTAGNPHIDFDVRRMLDNGVHTTIGSDWGAVPDPCLLEALGRIAESVGKGDRAEGGKTLCRLMTINGAQAVGREKELGSIEVGKKANFILVSQDLSQGEFEGAKVLRTYFEGEEVWNINK